MKMKTSISILILILLAVGIMLLQGWCAAWIWNEFLIGWAGLNLPIIGYWRAFLVTLIASFIFGGGSSVRRSR